MSERKFKFVSPGIFINEIDNSQLTRTPGDLGPVIIGRTERGPAMRPVKVNSFSEFVEIFGNPIPGGSSGDVFRNGNYTGPTYAGYAAQAWFKNNNSATVVRLLGAEHASAAASTDGQAGWDTSGRSTDGKTSPATTTAAMGGAYGLFLIDSGSVTNSLESTGALAAVFYATSGTYITITGSLPGPETKIGSHGCTFMQSSADKEFTMHIRNDEISGYNAKKVKFNFTEASSKYIRKVFNTNPQLSNSNVTNASAREYYWLGETYDGHVADHIKTSTQLGFIAPLHNSTPGNACLHRRTLTPSRSGWIISQDVTANTGSYSAEKMQKLFRFVALESGEWEQQNLKVSIQDIKKSTSLDSPYGSFTVVVRMAKDSDNSPRVVERYVNCNLNPSSNDYIARKIGNAYSTWDDTERRHRHYGRFPNVSRHIRMDMNIDVDNASTNGDYLPAGFFGAPRYQRFGVVVTSQQGRFGAFHNESIPSALMLTGAQAVPGGVFTGPSISTSGDLGAHAIGNDTYPYLFPAPALRLSASDGSPPSMKQCYWGVTTQKPGGTSTGFDESYKDAVRILADGALDSDGIADTSKAFVETSYVFSLDDISGSSGQYVYVSGSRAGSGDTTLGSSARGTSTFDGALLDNDLDRFTVDLHGGFDGLDITEKEPFRNSFIDDVSTTPYERNNYAYNTIKRAVDSVADPEVSEFNLMLCPGLFYEGLTSHMINVCEDRGDALAIIDLKGDYTAFTETATNAEARKGAVSDVVTNLTARSLNTSYGCAYYPWIQIRDPQQGNYVWVPPSVVALGTFASSEKRSELWFAPAGFRRGGLTEGAAGLPVINVAERLTSADRDKLYAANINPIATFPSEGIVIFGQKTLQVTPSALDRINVRRLMIHVKKEVSRMATQVLFDQNVQATWNRFLSLVKPFLRDIKIKFGLDAFKVVLDETTTTPDLVDRNIMYAKIFLKPTKAIEFIALDFVITNDGAAFED